METTEVTKDAQEETKPKEEGGDSKAPVINDPKAVLEALERAKTDAKTNRERLEEREAKVAELQKRIDALSSDEVLGKYKRTIVELQVKAALEKEGIKETDRVVKYLALADYDLDDDGNVTGFQENLAQVKKDLPELFDTKRRVGGAADLFRNEEVKQSLSPTEIQLRALQKNR